MEILEYKLAGLDEHVRDKGFDLLYRAFGHFGLGLDVEEFTPPRLGDLSLCVRVCVCYILQVHRLKLLDSRGVHALGN